MNPERLVFTDEIGVATGMARRHGRCPRALMLCDHYAIAVAAELWFDDGELIEL